LIPAVGPRLVRYYGELTGGLVVDRFPLPCPDRPYRTTVLASGNGSNFQAVIDGVAAGRLPLDVRLLVVNRRDAFALERARRNAIDSRTLVWDRKGVSREAYDDSVLSAVSESNPELVLLLGWMHVLRPDFIEHFPQTLNIHPALLPYDARADRITMPDGEETPVFLGAHAVDDALAAGAGWIGACVHRLSCEVDRGEVLARAPLRVDPTESRDQLDARLHELEHKVLERAILRWTYEFKTLQ
jgi:folate-dependent phosphoribosylglycinamide formyltransferase PurN